MATNPLTKSYRQRAESSFSNGPQIAKDLLILMETKRTNLSLSADVTSSAELLRLADLIGPEICVLKTHVDILTDFDETVALRLVQLAEKHRFMIFEDRKFADIGNTVYHQYRGGLYKIADWAHITNAHSLPGQGIVDGLRKAANEVSNQSRGLLLLAEMSSAGSLLTGEYTEQTVKMAEANRDFVFGFVAGRRLPSMHDFLYFSPGVQLESGKDALGQQYRTPEIVIGECGSDIAIVGRGIISASDPLAQARTYRERSWSAYLSRLSQ